VQEGRGEIGGRRNFRVYCGEPVRARSELGRKRVLRRLLDPGKKYASSHEEKKTLIARPKKKRGRCYSGNQRNLKDQSQRKGSARGGRERVRLAGFLGGQGRLEGSGPKGREHLISSRQ